MQNIILHLDMNSYFASCEQQDNLSWRGRPVGVCEHLGGIIIGASVEAKKWGITTGTPVWEARKIYPKIILTHTHPDRYRFFTRRLIRLVSDYTDKVEVYSIDEVFLDVTKVCNVKISNPIRQLADQVPNKSQNQRSKILNLPTVDPFEEAVKIAQDIKARMKTEVGDYLRCSVGLAENKLLAKISSDMKKPDGLVVIKSASCHFERRDGGAEESLKYSNIDNHGIRDSSARLPLADFCRDDANFLVFSKADLYQRLKLTDIPGIGRRQERNLNELGIKTLKDLRDFPKSHLAARFGAVMGHHLYNMGQLQGTWKAKVEEDDEIKSMGHMYTLPAEFRKPEFFFPVLYKLCEMVGRRLRRKELMGSAIHLYFHDKDYEGFGQSIKLGYFVQDGREIFLECVRAIERDKKAILASSRARSIKLVGVTVAGLVPFLNQLSLFGDAERHNRVIAALDEVNDKYGEFTVIRALQLPAGKVFRDSVGFGRVKEL